jgi:hypothetical protein
VTPPPPVFLFVFWEHTASIKINYGVLFKDTKCSTLLKISPAHKKSQLERSVREYERSWAFSHKRCELVDLGWKIPKSHFNFWDSCFLSDKLLFFSAYFLCIKLNVDVLILTPYFIRKINWHISKSYLDSKKVIRKRYKNC